MLTIVLENYEAYDYDKEEFINLPPKVLKLEHSLVSLSKWESKWEKPFLDTKEKTDYQMKDYIRCMVLDQELSDLDLARLSGEKVSEIDAYVSAKMSATWFAKETGKPSREIITSELIYYWMISLNIPFECQYWHLSRLLTLIQVCSKKNAPAKKMGKSDIASRNRALNAQRKAQLNTSG